MNIDQYVLNWLKSKHNYIYHSKFDTQFINHRFQILLRKSLLHYSDLNASSHYIIKQNIDIQYKLYKADKHHYTFDNFVFDKIRYIDHLTYFRDILSLYVSPKLPKNNNLLTASKLKIIERRADSLANRARILSILSKLTKELIGNNKSTNKNDNFMKKDESSFGKKFIDVNKENIDNFNNSISDFLASGNFSYFDFESYIDEIKKNKIEHAGVFFPYKFGYDIFKNEFHLLEINPIRFRRTNNLNFISKVKKYYKGYAISEIDPLERITLEKYFYIAEQNDSYDDNMAYFDPIIYLEKNHKNYEILINYIRKNNFDHKKFVFDLFDLFNQIQYKTIIMQYANLFQLIKYNRSSNRQYSFREALQEIIKDLNKYVSDDSLPEERKKYVIGLKRVAEIVEEKISKIKSVKNITVDDLFPNNKYNEVFRDVAQNLLKIIKEYTTQNLPTLQGMIDIYTEDAKYFIEKYSLNNMCKKVIIDDIKDIVLLYKDESKENLSHKLNSTFNILYKKYQKQDFDKIINPNFYEEFTAQYKNLFDDFEPWHKW